MTKKKSGCGSTGNESGCGPAGKGSCCRVDSIVAVDERGQMVLPKELREKAGIRPGDKMAVVSWDRDGEVCCLTLIKVENLTSMVKGMLGPLVRDLF